MPSNSIKFAHSRSQGRRYPGAPYAARYVNKFGVFVMSFRKIGQIVVAVFTVLVLSTPATANEDIVLKKLYESFNSELANLGFIEASRLFEEGKIRKALKALKSADIDLIRSFYSKQYAASNEECHSLPDCRESDLIFLSVITFREYKVISIGSKKGETRKMGVSGTNGSATEIKLVVDWLNENGNWKIDGLMKVPVSWNINFE